ncbi:hypothetical protein C5167_035582 [Papaver somniferum]|uniref:FACT complex subunit n=1 Tax=Papaver somniferum TaxID=3469 RepID=A0A4Y7KHK6_PAPSO|nr:hypothetical protein C5167_035582 [Papaver somniferum]
MSSSVRETLDMIEQKLLSKKLEALHLLQLHRLNQAELAHLLKRRCADRLLGGETATGSVGNCSAAENMDLYWADPRIQEYMYPKQENHWILQLPDVILEGPATLGTLEARGSGFIFTAPDFQLHFKDTSDLNKFHFQGVLPSQKSPIFALTDSALVMLMLPPFYVVPLSDVEFVNLAEVESGAFDMTVVFQDYSRDVLQICTIDITKLAGIKRILNDAYVKYYCNTKKLAVKEWNSILREIVASPKKFIECGGWESLHLEDELTLSCYDLKILSAIISFWIKFLKSLSQPQKPTLQVPFPLIFLDKGFVAFTYGLMDSCRSCIVGFNLYLSFYVYTAAAGFLWFRLFKGQASGIQ